jgi:hypothetical protein
MGFYLGLMSGTSMDAIDAALVDFDTSPLRIVAASATPFDPTLKRRMAEILDSPAGVELDELGQVDVDLAKEFAGAVSALLHSAGVGADQVTAIGSHGQTLRHRPDLPTPFTWQIADPSTLCPGSRALCLRRWRAQYRPDGCVGEASGAQPGCDHRGARFGPGLRRSGRLRLVRAAHSCRPDIECRQRDRRQGRTNPGRGISLAA